MWHWIDDTDGVLRARSGPGEPHEARRLLVRLVASVCLFGMVYGAVMGSFGGLHADRLWQLLFSASKVPLLLLGTFSLCLPSYFVLNTVAGLRSDFGCALRLLLAAQVEMTIALCSLAPLTVLWYLSSGNYHAAIVFNGLAFAVASLATQASLRRRFRPLVQRSRKHQILLRAWLGLYIFVGIQLGWLLRPFVGEPNSAVQLFRADAWGNAYVEVFRHLAGLLLK
ncbi:MAG: hypothetical protein AB9869_17400 [Verrucomicrobiia bacterium]